MLNLNINCSGICTFSRRLRGVVQVILNFSPRNKFQVCVSQDLDRTILSHFVMSDGFLLSTEKLQFVPPCEFSIISHIFT